jgi:hypothetical protein
MREVGKIERRLYEIPNGKPVIRPLQTVTQCWWDPEQKFGIGA